MPFQKGNKIGLGRKMPPRTAEWHEKRKNQKRLSGDENVSRRPEVRKKISEAKKGVPHFNQRGEKNTNWKGGITPLIIKVRNCFEYRQWRSDIYTRDDYTCQMCGTRGGELNVDHFPKSFASIYHENNIVSFEQALNCEEFWNINNGRTLCLPCHNKTKRK
jgi:5-methylcytosine-specific restriction endonuclease McrA